MMSSSSKEGAATRRRIALVTNHGYAGVHIPVGGAPDTGGQNFYVNSLALALEGLGWEVTVFARGGFPFFEQQRIREGVEKLSDHVRYVYIPGGGDEFIRKEDIAIALDEESRWLSRFICDEARAKGVAPWELFECINSHYWDAAVIVCRVVERWKDQVAHALISSAADGVFAPFMDRFEGDARHGSNLAREVNLHLGELAVKAFPGEPARSVCERLLQDFTIPQGAFEASDAVAEPYREIEHTRLLGRQLARHLSVDGPTLAQRFAAVDTHVWTPHSVGIIKERNFRDKPDESVRALKFRERNAHEESVCHATRRFCSTSPEIWRALVSYHGVDPAAVFDFPPCVDAGAFRPRTADELTAAYGFLAERSSLPIERLRSARIVFETSRMDRTKRKDLLLRAFATVAERIDDAYLFIGGGPTSSLVYRELESQLASTPSLAGRAFLLGFIPEEVVEPLFSLADVFASGSEMEGFGMSVSQAASAGVAVVASDLIPFATQYAPDAAVVFPAGDADALAKALIALLDHGEERKRRAARLMEIAGRLNWTHTAARFLAWFERTAG